jgi:transcriptional regulator with PAS, ATPase and Fis domain
VGSSEVQKTDVRIVAATNLKMNEAIKKGKFREDLYYRLSTVEIDLPPLRERKNDITLLFRKFASDFAQKYKMPTLRLDDDSQKVLEQYRWSGNIRQLRNIAEQVSVLEKNRLLNADTLRNYLPNMGSQLPAVIDDRSDKEADFSSEREILYKVLFDMKNDLNDLKKLTHELMENENMTSVQKNNPDLIRKIYGELEDENKAVEFINPENKPQTPSSPSPINQYDYAETVIEEEPLSLLEKEIEMIKQALKRSNGKRKTAAKELGISERTLYRKIKQFDLQDEENE